MTKWTDEYLSYKKYAGDEYPRLQQMSIYATSKRQTEVCETAILKNGLQDRD